MAREPDEIDELDNGQAMALALRKLAVHAVHAMNNGKPAHCSACRDFYEWFGVGPRPGDAVFAFDFSDEQEGVHQCLLVSAKYHGPTTVGTHLLESEVNGQWEESDTSFLCNWSASIREAATMATLQAIGRFQTKAKGRSSRETGHAIVGLTQILDAIHQRYGVAVAEATGQAIAIEQSIGTN